MTYRPEDATAGHPLRLLLGDAATATGTRRHRPGPAVARRGRERWPPSRRTSTPARRLPSCTRHRRQPVLRHRGARGRRGERARRPSGTRCWPGSPGCRRRGQRALDVVALAGARAEADAARRPCSAPGFTALDEPLERGLLRLVGGDVLLPARARPAAPSPSRCRPVAPALAAPAAPRPRCTATGATPTRPGWPTTPRRPATRSAVLGVRAGGGRAGGRARRAPGGGRGSTGGRCATPTPLPPAERAELLWALGYECYLTDQIEDALEPSGEALRALGRGSATACGSATPGAACPGCTGSPAATSDGRASTAEPRRRRCSSGTGSVELAMALQQPRPSCAMLATPTWPAPGEWGAPHPGPARPPAGRAATRTRSGCTR